MPNEQTNKSDTQGTEADKTLSPTDKTLSPTDKTLSPTDKFLKAKEEFKEENDRREKLLQEEKKLKADNMLGGEGGGHVEAKPVKEETPKEYDDRIATEISEGKHDD